ncbi:PTS fructose transporter subunit IIABC [Aquibacillus albus]|uniref:PTS system fructose-specific IIC component n=1 Tax=Aquibacillus albus TaxID=1168171 RepID=A0ABS2MZ12_9BACI|nr:fructose-specific PTS transporter subunit EIIC [Aquibacillus albus]MBM7571043.1 PTS system fructose-specific IIC component [Aquibacillus albus]
MNITDLLKKDTIILQLEANSKSSVIDELADKLDQAGRLHDKQSFKDAILARESQSTTGIGEGIAIPHAKSEAVKTPAIAFGRSKEGVDYEALDGQPSHLFFMIAASEGANQTHLETLSRLSTFLMDDKFRQKLEQATSEDEVIELINQKEQDETEDEDEQTPEQDRYLLAVTGCPTGIAHTYMAADKLKATAKEMGISIKVETNGSGGVKNRITPEEIDKADAIIVAADTKIEMERFKGKPLIQVPVAKGIHEPKQLIERAIKKDAPTYQGGDSSPDEKSDDKGRTGLYKHLMNGVSNMLPFVVGGGILIAISFLFGIHSADPTHEQYNRFAEMLMTIGGGNAFYLMVPVLAGFIASSIADRPGFAPGMVAGLIAITTGIEGASGGSGFLGGLIAGFLAGYLTLFVKKVLEVLPAVFDGLKTVLLYPVFSIGLTGIIMLIINPPLTTLYTGLSHWLEGLGNTNLVLLGIILGGMMAIDMGGPINKAAYTFGIAMLDAGNFNFIAAIMAGGMVPPLATGLATSIFRNRFTKQEREAGKSNYALGAFFITEGAIPFAAADPARIIPSIILGSAVAGGLTMLFDIGLRAPHGGIVVAGLVEGNALLYLLAILIGTIISAFLIGFLKKDLEKE